MDSGQCQLLQLVYFGCHLPLSWGHYGTNSNQILKPNWKDTSNLDALNGKILALQKLKRNKDASTYCNKGLEMYPYDSDIINCIVKMPQKHDFGEENEN